VKSLAFYSMKGGVGKTTLCVLYAAHLAQKPGRVLLIDLDPQGAAGFFFGVAPRVEFARPEFRKKGFDPAWILAAIRETDFPSLDILPSGLEWGALDVLLSGIKKPRKALLRLLANISSRYDRVIFDCPPGLSLLAENVFRAAETIIVPVIPSPLAARALTSLSDFFAKAELPTTRILPVFSMVQRGRRLHRESLSALRAAFPRFASTEIPYCSQLERVSETLDLQLPLRSRSRAAVSLNALFAELDALDSAPPTAASLHETGN